MMVRRVSVMAFGLAILAGATTSACSSTSADSSSAASAAPSAAAAASSAVGVVKSQISGFANGLDASGDVTVGSLTTDSSGRSTSQVTVKNSTGKEQSYAVQVNFNDSDGELLDTVVVTVDNVQPGATANAVARSTHSLSGAQTASVGIALRN